MKITVKFLLIMVLIISLFCAGVLTADKYVLRTQVIRMHVIADSDSQADQIAKLCVRDAVVERLEKYLCDVNDVAEARKFIRQELGALEEIANAALKLVGSDDFATVTLTTEKFGKRKYDTFSLPSGIYESLRVEIGSGKGRNWWCVVFPALCAPKTIDEFESVAVSNGFHENFVDSLSNDRKYNIRFYLLDCIGKIENFLNYS